MRQPDNGKKPTSMDEAVARLAASVPCLEPMLHSGGVCMLPADHAGPHGWDYEKQKLAVETPRMAARKLREGGLGVLADRLDRLQHE